MPGKYLLGIFGLLLVALPAWGQGKAYRLPSTSLKEQVIWGSRCELPDGTGLAFGGQDQLSEDGRPHTRIKADGKWQAIHLELQKNNPFRLHHTVVKSLAKLHQKAAARARHVYFQGHPPQAEVKLARSIKVPYQDCKTLVGNLEKLAAKAPAYEAGQARAAVGKLKRAADIGEKAASTFHKGITPETIKQLSAARIALEQAAEYLGSEPPPRALSTIVHDAQTQQYVLFGGDHLDFLTNDVWLFDPAKKKWLQQHPPSAPPPRANHQIKIDNGKVVVTRGYTYTSSTDYIGGQYRDHVDGPWTYDIARQSWSGKGEQVGADTRVYRTGKFHPSYYLEGDKPDAAAFQKRLSAIGANTWVMTEPPHLPRLNRDWGTAVLDPDRDLILRWSGGHSAHGGTDVLHYHLQTNRWELPIPVEFPLGQLYSNTSYPAGFNLNRRPWITGHTYQNYGYDRASGKMIFTGRHRHFYFYDPQIGDWVGRKPKPKGMIYNSCFYTLTVCPVQKTLVTWTKAGRLFQYDPSVQEWFELKLEGKLPGAVVDNSTVVYDSRRHRLLFARKLYGRKNQYDGQLHAVDLKTRKVTRLNPAGAAAAQAISYLCQIRYDEHNDIFLVGATLPPDEGGLRRTPAYDPKQNRWVSLKLTGSDPSGKRGRNVSLGLMYDAGRRMFWAVDTHSKVFVLRLDLATADVQPLR